jgi:hypothetical protein
LAELPVKADPCGLAGQLLKVKSRARNRDDLVCGFVCGSHSDKRWGKHNETTIIVTAADCVLGCAGIDAVTNTARILLNADFTVKRQNEFLLRLAGD